MKLDRKYRKPVPSAPPASTRTILSISSASHCLLNQNWFIHFLELYWPILKRLALQVNFNDRSLRKTSADKRFGQRILDMFLQCASQRPRAIRSIGAGLFYNPALCVGGHLDLKLSADQRSVQLSDKQSYDFEKIGVG